MAPPARPLRHMATISRMIRRLRPFAAPLAGCMGLLIGMPPLLAAPGPVGPAWSIGLASQAHQASELAVERQEHVLLWHESGPARAATSACLLVHASFAVVQPAVHKALGALGHFNTSQSEGPLAYQLEGWDEVILSRRPDLREALVARTVRPRLELAQQQGAITAAELDLRLAQARAKVASAPQDRIELAGFQVRYGHYHAQRATRHGWLGRSHSELQVDVFDVSAAFGRPTTAVQMRRRDETPNPRYSAWSGLFDVNILGGGGTPRTLTGSVVPAEAFTAVHKALASVSAGERVQAAPSPTAWVAPLAPPQAAPTITFTAPRADHPPLPADTLPWLEVAGLPPDPLAKPRNMLTLPDGDLLLSFTGGKQASVWRLHQAGRHWQARAIWQGKEGADHLALSADGRTAWFDGARPDGRHGALVAYDVANRQARTLLAHSTASTGQAHGDSEEGGPGMPRRWELSGAQWPTFFDHTHLPDHASPIGRFVLASLQPTGPAPAQGGPWPYQPHMRASRQSMMGIDMKGNTLIWPVRWRGEGSQWTEDQAGIAELQAGTGRVLRAHRVPQRFGEIDQLDASGVASWVPTPLGSPQAQWIALGFVLMLPDDGKLPPRPEARGATQRFVGMHVVNTQDGRVCLSALLGRADVLRAAARSANGQLLALGSERASARTGTPAALWDVRTCQPSLRLAVPERSSIEALAFSWQGTDLWGASSEGLLRWRLPEGLTDAARAGSHPDQSRD